MCEGAGLWKSHTEGMSPVHPAVQCRHPAPRAEADQTRQHQAQQLTSLSTLKEIQNKQNLNNFNPITASEVLNQKKLK